MQHLDVTPQVRVIQQIASCHPTNDTTTSCYSSVTQQLAITHCATCEGAGYACTLALPPEVISPLTLSLSRPFVLIEIRAASSTCASESWDNCTTNKVSCATGVCCAVETGQIFTQTDLQELASAPVYHILPAHNALLDGLTQPRGPTPVLFHPNALMVESTPNAKSRQVGPAVM